MATAAMIQVPNAPALRQTIDSYIVQGYSIAMQDSSSWWWSEERQNWVGVLESLPAGTQVSGDRKWWWDGGEWRRLPVPTDSDRNGELTTRDASDGPVGLPTPENSETAEPRPGEWLPPPPGI